MAETMKLNCDGLLGWHWFNIMSDLEKQGGLAGVVIDPLSFRTNRTNSCGGQTGKGTIFYITWIPDTLLLVSMSQEEQALVEAFAKVVEYRPFCKYINECGILTIEWDKNDPDGRFAELEKKGEKDLQRIR